MTCVCPVSESPLPLSQGPQSYGSKNLSRNHILITSWSAKALFPEKATFRGTGIRALVYFRGTHSAHRTLFWVRASEGGLPAGLCRPLCLWVGMRPIPDVVFQQCGIPSPLLLLPLEFRFLQMSSFISEFPSGPGKAVLDEGLFELGVGVGLGEREVEGGKGD